MLNKLQFLVVFVSTKITNPKNIHKKTTMLLEINSIPNVGRIHVGMLIHFQGNASTTVIRCGIDILHAFYTSQHSLQATGHFRLDDTRRITRHRERDRQSRQAVKVFMLLLAIVCQ